MSTTNNTDSKQQPVDLETQLNVLNERTRVHSMNMLINLSDLAQIRANQVSQLEKRVSELLQESQRLREENEKFRQELNLRK